MENLLMYGYDYYYITTGAIIGFIIGGIISIVLCFVAGSIAKKKGRSYAAYWFLTFFLGIIGLIIAACVSDESRPQNAPVAIWFCKKCSRSNPVGSSFCSNCGTPRNDFWKCANCGESNESINQFCRSCGKKKDFKPQPVTPKNVETWKCPDCGYDNNINSTMCIECGKERP